MQKNMMMMKMHGTMQMEAATCMLVNSRLSRAKKYAFRNDGRMLSGLKFILENDNDLLVKADDDGSYPFDNEDDFLANAANYYEGNGYKCYYFGDGEDGAMRTGKLSVSIDGENQNFYFQEIWW